MEQIYKIATSFLNGFGPVQTKKVIAYTGSLEAFFTEKKQKLEKIPGIGKNTLNKLNRKSALSLAEEELRFISDNKIQTCFYLDKNYPQRLLNCPDVPCTLYYKGQTDFNTPKSISIVGTRNSSDYGKELCNKLITELAERNINATVVSGLAYGIDICAHKAALANNLPTVAAVGHGLHLIYPSQHKTYSQQIIQHGALITEFTSKSKFDPKNFVRRNRIIAGMSDATIVIESAKKGGSLVTADLANSYNRDVFAFPGRTTDLFSSGCNHLIKTNQAHLIENASDLLYILGWETNVKKPSAIQPQLFTELSTEEELLVNILKENKKLAIDLISIQSSFPMSKVSSLLLKMEFKGIIKSHPGKIYSLNS